MRAYLGRFPAAGGAMMSRYLSSPKTPSPHGKFPDGKPKISKNPVAVREYRDGKPKIPKNPVAVREYPDGTSFYEISFQSFLSYGLFLLNLRDVL